ncbi:MAG: polyphosphate polymerase domain-containing protein [Methanoregulaceae archaeon]|jgi:hypothetical protein
METGRQNPALRGEPESWSGLSTLVSGLEPVSLSGMEDMRAQLLTRVESKHLMTLGVCRELVEAIADSYRVLAIRGTRIGNYMTMYYDTPSFLTYLEHHNGKGNRAKLRLRYYASSGETYLEVKKKNNKGATEKSRFRTSWKTGGFGPEERDFLRSAFPHDSQAFHPVLTTMYHRLTLVSNQSPERVTFDTGISFSVGQKVLSYPEFVIGEVKYEKGMKNSPALQALHAMGLRKRGFSKYCIGVSLLYDGVKHNRFKPKLLALSRYAPAGGVPC